MKNVIPAVMVLLLAASAMAEDNAKLAALETTRAGA